MTTFVGSQLDFIAKNLSFDIKCFIALFFKTFTRVFTRYLSSKKILSPWARQNSFSDRIFSFQFLLDCKMSIFLAMAVSRGMFVFSGSNDQCWLDYTFCKLLIRKLGFDLQSGIILDSLADFEDTWKKIYILIWTNLKGQFISKANSSKKRTKYLPNSATRDKV